MDKMRRRSYGVVTAGVLMMLIMGIAYVWGIYVTPLIETFGWTKAQASLPFSVFLLFYTVGMIAGGRLQDRYGPRRVCAAGALLFGLGYLLSGFASSLLFLCLVYGVLGGLGTGLAYVTPVATVVKWFPHKKGLVSGIVIFGFGAGAFLFSPVVRGLVSAYGWDRTFLILGSVFLVAALILPRFITLPPDGTAAGGAAAGTARAPSRDLAPSEVLKTPVFWLAWTAWFLALTVGLGLMGHVVAFATDAGVDAMAAAFILSVIAIFNGAGRIVFGGISDILGRTRLLAGGCLGIAAAAAGFTWVGGNVSLLYLLGAVFGMCFGTLLVLYPMIAADLFGTRNLGVNYGLLFSSYGIGGVVGPVLYGRLHAAAGGYGTIFMASAVVCLLAGALAAGVRVLEANGERAALKGKPDAAV